MGFFDRWFRRQQPPEMTRDAAQANEPVTDQPEEIKQAPLEKAPPAVRTAPVAGGSEKIKRLFVCGKTETASSQYEAAEHRVVGRAIEARRGRLFPNQKVTTLRGPDLPDREVESFVRVLQMKHGTGLLAYRTESCVEDGFSFLIIEMLSPSASRQPPAAAQTDPAEVTVNAVAYPVADSIERFCELGHRERRAALRFAPHEYGKVLMEVAQWFERKCGLESGPARAARGLDLMCGKCCGAFSGMHHMALANASGRIDQPVPCRHCGTSQVLALYRFVEPESITKEDVADIWAFQREQGRGWWASHPNVSAVCDSCNRPLARGEGWLSGSWLKCETCAARSFDTALDDLKRNPNHFGAGVLDLARRAAGRS